MSWALLEAHAGSSLGTSSWKPVGYASMAFACGRQSSLAVPMEFYCSAGSGPGSSKKGYGCSVQKSIKQDIYLVGTSGVLPWDCAVLGTLEPISVNVAMHF